MPTASEGTAFEVRMTDEAVYGYSAVVPTSVYERVGFLIENLGTFPYYGGEYRPYYRAAMPDIATRVFYCGHYGVYYAVDDQQRIVTVLAVEDERMNPLGRFSPLAGGAD